MQNNDGYNGASFVGHPYSTPLATKDVLHKNSMLYRRSVLGRVDEGGMGDRIGVGHGDLLMLELVLATNPAISNLVELGTWYGYTSLYLGMAARLRGGALSTFDIVDLRPDDVKAAWLPEMFFFGGDLFSETFKDASDLASLPNTFLFVDNGDKPHELALFHSCLKPGSIVAVHDWEDEIGPADVSCLKTEAFEPILHDAARLLHSSVRAWRKR